MSLLLNLPPDLITYILIDWIRCKEIGKLDTAATNKEKRGELLDHIQLLPAVTFSPEDVIFYKWANSRGLRLRTLHLVPNHINKITRQLKYEVNTDLITDASMVDLLTGESKLIATKIILLCSNLTSLTCFNDVILQLTDNCLANLTKLSVQPYSSYDMKCQEELERIVDHCHKLEAISLYFETSPINENLILTLIAKNPQLKKFCALCSHRDIVLALLNHCSHLSHVSLEDIKTAVPPTVDDIRELINRVGTATKTFIKVESQLGKVHHDTLSEEHNLIIEIRDQFEMYGSLEFVGTFFPDITSFTLKFNKRYSLANVTLRDVEDNDKHLDLSNPNKLKKLRIEGLKNIYDVIHIIKCSPQLEKYYCVIQNEINIREYIQFLRDLHKSGRRLDGILEIIWNVVHGKEKILTFHEGKFGGKNIDNYLTVKESFSNDWYTAPYVTIDDF